ncbi:MAG: ABC transporter permease [Chloroflexi bacterium]|nr:ABC transporter permease [Chloroflexota bacterium]
MKVGDSIRLVFSSVSGRIGAALLAALVIVSAAVPFFYPLDFGLRFWNNPVVWADNPKAVPPVWTAIFDDGSHPRHRAFEAYQPSDSVDGVATGQNLARTRTFRFAFAHDADSPPTFIALALGEMTFYDRPPVVTMSLTRPDGKTVRLVQQAVRGVRSDETAPVSRYADAPLRIFLSGDAAALSATRDFLEREFDLRVSGSELQGRMESVLFGSPGNADSPEITNFDTLQGDYEATVRITTYDARDTVEMVRFVAGGAVFGMMGTDAQGRDLATGLLFGFPVALLIGVLTSVGATAIGTFFGILSGFMGGKTDILIQRGADVLTNIPLLPILIFLIFILGQRLWLVMGILVLFGWPGLTIVLRAMVLQVRSGQLVEATMALGASKWRIMFRHIFFQMAPFIIAQMIFFTPAAILAEAGLSFLGLGDPSLPTWGQILEQSFRTGAIYVGYWWWILPPGILIVITAMAFVLLALALEPVLNPRLRGRAS